MTDEAVSPFTDADSCAAARGSYSITSSARASIGGTSRPSARSSSSVVLSAIVEG